MTLETSICQVYHYENPQAPHRGVFQHQVATDAMARGDQPRQAQSHREE